MFFEEKGGNDGIETDGFAGAGGTCHEEVGHFGEVGYEGVVADGFAKGYGEFHFAAVAESVAIEHAFHGDYLGFCVGDFDADGAFAWDGCYDTNAKG